MSDSFGPKHQRAVKLTRSRYVEIDYASLIPESKSDLLVKVQYCGICGSDRHKFLAEELPAGYLKTQILGHEFSGVIAFSPSHSELPVGSRVSVMPILYCGECHHCLSGRIAHCVRGGAFGRTTPGGFAEYVSVPTKNAYVLPDGLPSDVAALSDPFACALYLVDLIPKGARKILIVGDGAIALAVAQIALKQNVQVTILVKHPEHVLLLESDNRLTVEKWERRESLPKDTFDVALECVGGVQTESISLATRVLKVGGRLVIGGVFDFSATIPIREIGRKELSVLGANSFLVSKERDHFFEAIRYLADNVERVRPLITHVFDLACAAHAFEFLTHRASQVAVVKILLSN